MIGSNFRMRHQRLAHHHHHHHHYQQQQQQQQQRRSRVVRANADYCEQNEMRKMLPRRRQRRRLLEADLQPLSRASLL